MSRTGEEEVSRCWPHPNRKPAFATDMFSKDRMKLNRTIRLCTPRVKQHNAHRKLMFPDSLHVMSVTACKS